MMLDYYDFQAHEQVNVWMNNLRCFSKFYRVEWWIMLFIGNLYMCYVLPVAMVKMEAAAAGLWGMECGLLVKAVASTLPLLWHLYTIKADLQLRPVLVHLASKPGRKTSQNEDAKEKTVFTCSHDCRGLSY